MRYGRIFLAAAWLLGSQALRADSDDAPSLRLQELEQRVRQLEARAASSLHTLSPASESPRPAAGPTGFSLSSADGLFRLRLGGYAHADARFFANDDANQFNDTFLIRRVRLILEGQLGEPISFFFMPDFSGGSSRIQDAYVNFALFPRVNLRVGRTKVPVGLERSQSLSTTLFSESGFTTLLTPSYDEGLMLFGSANTGAWEYAIGIFNGAPDGESVETDSNDGKDVAARFAISPFKNGEHTALRGLLLGIGASYGKQEGSAKNSGLPSYSTSGQNKFFTYRTSENGEPAPRADGDHTRIAPHLYYAVGPIGLLAEYILSQQEVKLGNKAATSLKNTAWQTSASWVLTGETPSLKGVTPLKPFNPSRAQWGALELKVRAGKLTIDDDTFYGGYADPSKSASSASAIGTGLNWYLSRNAKIALDLEQTVFDGGAPNGADRPDEQVAIARVQIAF
ncbi:MAG: OprO/OprP family phosphate-selective porin [Kiritimatiellae bacterium]|nr:OprO/OprP family phosphate-selective porin [Kiritimatiellia bacterium]